MKYNKAFLVKYAENLANGYERGDKYIDFRPDCAYCPLAGFCEATPSDVPCDTVVEMYYSKLAEKLTEMVERREVLQREADCDWNELMYVTREIIRLKKELGEA